VSGSAASQGKTAVPHAPFVVRVIEGGLWRLARSGLKLYPYVAVREAVEKVAVPALPTPLRAGWATKEHLDTLDALWSGRNGTTRARILARFSAGNRCFAIWDGDTITAATWCDFDVINHEPARRSLEPHEVYLFDAFVSPAARGRNLAPIMRAACYEACRSLGRSTMLSFTDYFNESSHRFKAKLGARRLHLALQVTLLHRWSHTFIVRRY
jgi:GNAT superfamily N-acetyltransferase